MRLADKFVQAVRPDLIGKRLHNLFDTL
jgi:hypothetical protein